MPGEEPVAVKEAILCVQGLRYRQALQVVQLAPKLAQATCRKALHKPADQFILAPLDRCITQQGDERLELVQGHAVKRVSKSDHGGNGLEVWRQMSSGEFSGNEQWARRRRFALAARANPVGKPA